jgi:hypothetical protein
VSIWRFLKTVVSSRKQLRASLRAIRHLPRLRIPLTGSAASQELTRLLREGIGPFRPRSYAVAVLEIPSETGAYRKGRARQALRTNSAKARADGTSCRTLLSHEEVLVRFGHIIVDGRGIDPESRTYRAWTKNVADEPYSLYFAAVAQDESTLVFCKIIVANEHARLHTFIHAEKIPAAGDSRFLLFDYVVENLRARGVRYLIVDRILALPDGVLYYQRLLGYSVYNLTVTNVK